MDNQRIHEMGKASETMDDSEFQSKFRMTKDEFLSQYESTEAGTWSKRSPVPETATNNSNTRSDAKEAPAQVHGPAAADVDEKVREQQIAEARQRRLDVAHTRRSVKRDSNIRRMGRRGSVGAFGFLGAVVDGLTTYSAERQEDPNGSKLVDGAKAVGTAAAWLYAPGIMWSIAGAGLATTIGKEIYEDANRNYQAEKRQATHITTDASGNAKGTLGGELIDSETAYTMRQRNEQVMRQHKIATESILGSEARQLHR